MKSFSVAKHRVKALIIYANGSKYKSRLPLGSPTRLNFGNEEEESQPDKIDQSSSQISLKEFLVNEAVTDAEIYWVLDVVQNQELFT